MSTGKHFDAVVAVVLALGLLLTVAFLNGEALGIEKIIDADAEQYEATERFTANDLDGDWDASNPTATITLNGTSARISGNGAYYNDGNVVITGAGRYVLSGALTDGSVVVDAYDASKVFLLFDGVELYCSDDACLRVEQADKVFLTLAAGSENRMESGETYSETALADNTGGTIFAHDDLTVNGSGSLAVVAGYKHGIDANDDLKITGGAVTITCPQDGLHVNDSFRFANASLTITAGDDGIHSDTDVYIESGTILITECYEGIEAPQIEVAGGDITLYPTDDGFNANGGSASFGMGGGFTPPDFSDGERPTPPDWSESGEMPTMPTDGEMPDFGGERPTPPTMDESGETPAFDGGESAADAASDDASETALDPWLHISGGRITIINETGRDADGLDTNGDLIITGGTVFVSLTGSGSNSALDYGSESGGVAAISGGTVIACGASAMAESFGSTSTQPSILYNTGAEAGTTVALKDADGNVLLTWQVPCSFTSMVMSCPELTLGESYTVAVGESEETITLAEVSASYGSAQSGGMSAMPSGGFGGMQGGGMGGGKHGGGHGGRPAAADTETAESTQ